MRRSKPTRLELHRLKYHQRGMVGPFLSFSELDQEERDILSRDVFQSIYLNQGRNPYEVVSEVFDSWGIRCNHPQARRLYEGRERSVVPTARFKWYNCESCGCSVINDDMPGDRPAKRVLG